MSARAKAKSGTSSSKSQKRPPQEQNAPPASAPVSPPQWPVLTPLAPTADLTLEAVVEKQILLIHTFFTSALCKKYVAFLGTLPVVTTPGKPKKGEAVRVNDRFQVTDPRFAHRLWSETGLRDMVLRADGLDVDGEAERNALWGGEPVGLNPSIRVYRYSEGQYFGCHYDESNQLLLDSPQVSTSTRVKTTWTLLIYLTSAATGCVGGETVFYPDDLLGKKPVAEKELVVQLETGMALLHRHGNDCMLHEGREVTAGEKWVIRSDLCVRR